MHKKPRPDTAAPLVWHTGRLGSDFAALPARERPVNSEARVALAELIDIPSLRALLDDLSALEGIATALLDLEGKILQSAGWQSACTSYHRAVTASCANCTESDLYLASHLQKGEFVDYRCKNGLWDVVTPVFVGELHLGNLYCGQFFYDDDAIDDGFFIAQAERFGYEPTAYLAAIHRIPRFSREHVRRVMSLIVGLASYLSHLSLTNQKLTESQSQLKALLNAVPDPVWLKDIDGTFVACNHSFAALLGAPAEKIIGRTDDAFFSAELASFFRSKDREAIAAGGARRNEELIPGPDGGQAILAETIKVPMHGIGGEAIGVLGIARDITARKRVEDELRLMSRVFSSSGEAIMITDAGNRILTVNGAFTRLTGYAEADVIGKDPRFLSAGNTPKAVYEEMWAALAEKGHWQGELWDRRKSGEPYPKRLTISVVRDAEDKVVNYIGNFEDITHRKATEERIRYLALHDVLTGLPNRFSLYERMEQCIAYARRSGSLLAVMLIDLDRFKSINDTLGHNAGDQLLIQVATRLQGAVRDSDIVARLGGDEFVVVLTDIENAADVCEISRKIIKLISEPYHIQGHELRTSPSIGICFYPDDATEINDLLKNADIAMYRSKASGRNKHQFYAPAMGSEVDQRALVENELAAALTEGQFVLHYQPQIDLESRRVIGVEALIRWQHPTRGLLFPGEFIATAEETGMIIALDKWVLHEACRQLRRWQEAGLAGLSMSVNLSAAQFQDSGLPAILQEALTESGIAATDLHLEITETVAMHDPEANIEVMRALTEVGVKLSIDDFGTGYSSLAYLKLFPAHTIKIDRSFVKDIERDDKDAAICEVTVLLANKLGVHIVAEGVETPAQLAVLSGIGCHQVQGYLFSKPLESGKMEAFLREFEA